MVSKTGTVNLSPAVRISLTSPKATWRAKQTAGLSTTPSTAAGDGGQPFGQGGGAIDFGFPGPEQVEIRAVQAEHGRGHFAFRYGIGGNFSLYTGLQMDRENGTGCRPAGRHK